MIERSTREDAVWIRLDRAEKMNALHLEGWRDLHDALERASEDARVAVITGTDDVFCAGDDIEVLDAMEGADDVDALATELRRVLFGIEELPIPVIAAVNGLAYGGGCEIVAASDLAVAVEDATFALPETRIGAYPPYAVERMAEMVGKKRSMELALTGEPIDAATALEWGLINRVTPHGGLADAVSGFVDGIVRSPKDSIRLAKRHALHGKPDRGDEDRIAGALARATASEGCRSATRAFIEGDGTGSESGE
ncbi:enoyl-CoA hydratase/isomerase family protein [Halalkalicoccus sp. NIPERK01]|uniref:enoyl-CoA hydratase/isomerase family protein n=1 Tax=Halalkalicoccus sp. NIPERK01 TaxID=3053469 RepID=UPI00256F480A|nr:enoyl-CoA hydratase/isomerase family protein [Halalkalicoccus sp. NIPERK01]MDL5363670.1 enoyl-CoA hydratase/isomerase family protein [Halalkalicoccus sp. NIPERK01]